MEMPGKIGEVAQHEVPILIAKQFSTEVSILFAVLELYSIFHLFTIFSDLKNIFIDY